MKAQRVTVKIDFLSNCPDDLKSKPKTFHLLIKLSQTEGYWNGPNPNYYHKTVNDAARQTAVKRFQRGSYFFQNSGSPDGYGSICKPVRTGGSSMDEYVRITVEKGWI